MATVNFNLLTLSSEYKLNGTNYVDWYRSIKLHLTAEGLYIVLNEQVPPQPDPNDLEAYDEMQEFFKRDSKASIYIIGSLEKSILDSVKDIHTSDDKMDKLAEFFNRQLTHAHSDVMSYKMSNKELELTEIANALVEAEATLKKDKVEEGHWKKNCRAFLATVKVKKSDDTKAAKEGVQGYKEFGKK
ncbi:uncharacterized protein LOC122659198 [Telopea speciosissima]|uniref:uncharacterized protein LOC122659198 n=1 Tax=Telopea speciosissima TaxID=54955 RepID=UPI001CC7DD78|nr:uncharacterized protein LOC122659198 [Telopea speciosissima]